MYPIKSSSSTEKMSNEELMEEINFAKRGEKEIGSPDFSEVLTNFEKFSRSKV